jgi:hypothetical protein
MKNFLPIRNLFYILYLDTIHVGAIKINRTIYHDVRVRSKKTKKTKKINLNFF